MASVADSFGFLNDRVHAVRVALSPVESGLRFAINDLESRFMDTCNALKRLETNVKNPPGSLLSPENPDSEIKKYSTKQVDASSKMDVIRRLHDSSHHFAVLTDKFQFKSLKTCFEKPDSTSLDKANTSHQKKKHAFLLERSLLVGLEALIQGIKELNGRSRVIGEKISDTSPASKPLPSHVDFLKIAKGLIKGRQDELNGFLSNIRFARVPQLSGLVGEHSSAKDEGEICSSVASNEEHKGWLVPLNIRNALLSIPLSNVERLKSTLSIAPIVELIELVPHLGRTWKDHPEKKKDYPDKKKLFCVQDFFRYTRSEGKRFFEELDRDGDGQITLEDLVVAMKKRRLSKRYAQEFFRCTRKHRFSKSIDWKQFLSLMEQREPTILRAYTTLCLSNSGTLQKNQVLTSLRSAGLPVNEYNAVAMIRYLNASKEGFISYRDFRNFMLLLPKERLLDDPRCTWFEAATDFHVFVPVKLAYENALNSTFAGGMACTIPTSMSHPPETMKVKSLASVGDTYLGTGFRILCQVLKQLQAGLFDNFRGVIAGSSYQDGTIGLYGEAKKNLLSGDLEPRETFVVGTFSSGMAGIITTPFNVMKNDMITRPHGLPVSMPVNVLAILRQEGPLGIFKGAIPRFFWIAPLGTFNFAGYDLVKQVMDRLKECTGTGGEVGVGSSNSRQLQERVE